jgi:DNA mismatch endonuclease Vsr
VRRILTEMGMSYRTCVKTLPGSPDIVNRKAGWVIFVHGCFWHGHVGCKLYTVPKTNKRFWQEKVAANKKRDGRKARLLRSLGYRVVTVWQCETKKPAQLVRRLRRTLDCEPWQMGGNDSVFLRAPKPVMENARSELRMVDLFSGCGGLSLGVGEAARLNGRAVSVRLAVESYPPIAKAYAANFKPAHGREASTVDEWFDGDIGEPLSLLERRTKKAVGEVDVLVGGPPCQGHSTLNNHTRGDDRPCHRTRRRPDVEGRDVRAPRARIPGG